MERKRNINKIQSQGVWWYLYISKVIYIYIYIYCKMQHKVIFFLDELFCKMQHKMQHEVK